MKLSFTPRALRAGRMGERMSETIELLAQFPELGHEGSLAGTRELLVPGLPYIVVHGIEARDPETMTVLGI